MPLALLAPGVDRLALVLALSKAAPDMVAFGFDDGAGLDDADDLDSVVVVARRGFFRMLFGSALDAVGAGLVVEDFVNFALSAGACFLILGTGNAAGPDGRFVIFVLVVVVLMG